MKVKLLVFISFFIANISIAQLFGPKKFKLPNGKLKPSQLCGLDVCSPGNLGIIFKFTKKPYSPDVDSNSTERQIATQILGHTFPEDNLYGNKAFTCSEKSDNPFSEDDVTPIGAMGRDIQYHRTEKLNINIEAATKTNLEELRKYTDDLAKLNRLEVSIKAAYSRIAGKDLTIIGRYSEWGLKRKVIERLVKNDGFQGCKEFLKAHNYRIITAIGLVYFDINYNTNSVDSLASEVQSAVEKEGIGANLSFTFKKEISQNLKATTKNYYQIFLWRSASLEDVTLFNINSLQ